MKLQMKLQMKLLTALILIVLFGCQSSEQSIMVEIANSSEFKEYMDIEAADAYALSTNAYNPNDIIEYAEKDPKLLDTPACDLDPSQYSEVRGIEVYLNMECSWLKSLDKLETKFKYRQLTSEQKKEIVNYFHTNVDPSHRNKNIEKIYNKLIQIKG